MSLHVFGAVVTGLGTAANNRGVTEGSVTTLQKILWEGRVHTTVSAEAIRFALRRRLAEVEQCNRMFDESTLRPVNKWQDEKFSTWEKNAKRTPFIDDDLLGFMSTDGAAEEREKSKVRRAVLEVTRAVSLTPWPGDVTFNAASPGATPSAQKKGTNPVPYGTEMHATRYQYGFALTPARLRVADRAAVALRGLCALGEVAGNHGRFLFDFSPESVVFRVTQDPAPRILYAFGAGESGEIGFPDLVRKVKAGDIVAKELIVGGAIAATIAEADKRALDGATIVAGVKAACDEACKRIGKAIV